MEKGNKADAGKPRFELIDPEWIEQVAQAMTFGATKYADNNWRGGLRLTRILGAALRHLWAVLRGEDNDPETGLSHLAHLGCNAMFAYWHIKYRPDLDDRWRNS